VLKQRYIIVTSSLVRDVSLFSVTIQYVNRVIMLLDTQEKSHLSHFNLFANFSSKGPPIWKLLGQQLAVPSDYGDRPAVCTHKQWCWNWDAASTPRLYI